MANLPRPPLITRMWRPSHIAAACLSQQNVAAFPRPLAGQDRFYGAPGMGPPQYDWPLPMGWRPERRVPAVLRQGHTDRTVQFIGLDSFFGLGGSPTFDWPLAMGHHPARKSPPILRQGWAFSFQLTLVGRDRFYGDDGMAAPQYDWPLPGGYRPERRFPAVLRQGFVDRRVDMIGQDAFFGLAGNPTFDWPVPLKYRAEFRFPSVVREGWRFSFQLTLIEQDAFYGLAGSPTFDWPVPLGHRAEKRRPAITRDGWTDKYNLNLIGQDQLGFAGHPNFDWPNPRLRVDRHGYAMRSWSETWQNYDALGYPAAPLPSNQYDWPNPVGFNPAFRHPGPLRGFIKSYQVTLDGQDTIYGAPGMGVPNYDWPVPKGYPRLPNVRVFYPESFTQKLVDQDAFDHPDTARRPLRTRGIGVRGTYWRGRVT